jgi:Tfp pilus assembly protein PilF
MPTSMRAAHADAVLAALGYRSDKPRAARQTLKLFALLAGLTALLLWLLIPVSELFPRRAAPAPTGPVAYHVPPPASTPATPAENRKPNPPPGSKIEGRDPRVEKPQNDPWSSILESRTPAQAFPPAVTTPPPAAVLRPSRVDVPDPRVGSPASTSRLPGAAPRAPAASSKVNAAVLPATRPENFPRPSISEPRAAGPAPDDFQLGLYYHRSGDFEQALLHYRAALQRDEMNVEAHNNLGHLYLGKGLFDEAAREFQRVIAIDPKYITAHVNLSAAYLSLGQFDAAAAEARAALRIEGRNPDAMVNLSLAQNAAGQAGDAQGSLRRALEIDPHNAAAHYNLARQFEAAGDVSGAIDHYRQFIQYAGTEQTAFAADVRTRLAALAARIK